MRILMLFEGTRLKDRIKDTQPEVVDAAIHVFLNYMLITTQRKTTYRRDDLIEYADQYYLELVEDGRLNQVIENDTGDIGDTNWYGKYVRLLDALVRDYAHELRMILQGFERLHHILYIDFRGLIGPNHTVMAVAEARHLLPPP